MKTGVYTITNTINNKMYIGFSVNINKRWIRHIDDLTNKIHHCKHLQDAWNLYTKNNFKFEILVECNRELLASEEHYWATILNTHNPEFGYNTRPTHPEGKVIQTEETKNKIALSNAGKTRTLVQKKYMSEKALEKFSKGFIVWNKGKTGIVVSEKTKIKIKNTMLEKNIKTNNGVGILKRRAVLQYDLNGNFIKEWNSLTEASLHYSGNKCSAIHKVCNNNQKTAYKYKWQWK